MFLFRITVFAKWSTLCCLLLLSGCSSVYVSSDFDPSIDRSRYVTYNWSSGEEGKTDKASLEISPFVYNRTRRSVDRELAARGYLLQKKGQVDFLVKIQLQKAVVSSMYLEPYYTPRYSFRAYRNGSRYFAEPFWQPYGSAAWVRYHEEGYLVIDIIDALSGAPAWRGSSWGVIRDRQDAEIMQQDIDRMVAPILEKFSPLKKKR
ncbi:MAG: DUF4136 domain-containing protein [Chlorobiaceae bacterium]|nr:DUF4136 domain-containing protein [Chlorobiaceae bacterium]